MCVCLSVCVCVQGIITSGRQAGRSMVRSVVLMSSRDREGERDRDGWRVQARVSGPSRQRITISRYVVPRSDLSGFHSRRTTQVSLGKERKEGSRGGGGGGGGSLLSEQKMSIRDR